MRAVAALRPPTLALLALGEIGVLFAVTRLARIDRMPWFVDEGYYGEFTRRVAQNAHDAFVSLSLGKEPLMFWLAAFVAKLGFNPLTAIRIVSLLAGVVTLAMVGLLARRLAGDLAAWLAMAVYALLPFFVVHDVVGIIDPLVTATMTVALWLQIELAERFRWRVALALGLVLAAGLLAKESGRLAVALLPLSLVCLDWRADGRAARLGRWTLGAGLAAGLAYLGSLIPHLSPMWDRVEALHRLPIVYPVRSVGDVLAAPRAIARENWPVYRDTLVGYVTLPVLAAAAIGLGVCLRRRLAPGVLVAAWFVVPFLAALLVPIGAYPRYLLYAGPAAVVLAGVGLDAAARRVAVGGSRAAAGAAACLVGLALVPALVRDARVVADPATARYPSRDDFQYVTGHPAGGPWPAVADELRRRTGGRAAFVVRVRAVTDVLALTLKVPTDRFVLPTDLRADVAMYAVRDSLPLPDPAGEALLLRRGPGSFRLIGTFPRPRGGPAVRLYERVTGS